MTEQVNFKEHINLYNKLTYKINYHFRKKFVHKLHDKAVNYAKIIYHFIKLLKNNAIYKEIKN